MNNDSLSKIYEQFICTVCGNISLLEANNPIAKELKDIINALYERGFDNNQIVDYMIKNYSDFIYLNSVQDFNIFYLLLWFFPILISIFFAYIVLRIYNKKSLSDEQLHLPFDN